MRTDNRRPSKVTSLSYFSINDTLYIVSVSEASVLKIWQDNNQSVAYSVDVSLTGWGTSGNTLTRHKLQVTTRSDGTSCILAMTTDTNFSQVCNFMFCW